MYITNLIVDIAKKENTNIAKRVLDYLDKDLLSIYEQSNKLYFFEYRMIGNMPKYVYNYITKKLAKLGYQYIYDKYSGRPFFA